jgi:hypothetical protein
MSTGKTGSGRANHLRQKQNRINEQKSSPTAGGAKESDDTYLPLKKPSVSPEKRGFDRFIETMSNWQNVLAFVGVVSGFSIWASTLQFGLNDAKDNITKHEKKLDDISVKLNNSQVTEAVNSSEIQNVKKNQDSVEKNIYSLQEKVEKLSEEKYKNKK